MAENDKPKNDKLIHRSAIFLRTFELDGFYQGLSQALAVGQMPGPVTKAYFLILVEGARQVLVGPAREDMPDFGSDPSPTDMLVAANVLRHLLTAFLTPDEREEQKSAQPWGLSAGARSSSKGSMCV
jgi:hypothetical protein